jgi:hypothetical protein
MYCNTRMCAHIVSTFLNLIDLSGVINEGRCAGSGNSWAGRLALFGEERSIRMHTARVAFARFALTELSPALHQSSA